MKKILVIDDEEWLREMVNMALAQKGYEVIEAESGMTGVELAQKQLPDLILCDVNMERMDGYLTLSKLRNEPTTSAIPFILMTGLADNAGMRHGMELGADDYLPKPFTIEGLYAAVEIRLKKALTVRQAAEAKLADLRDNISFMLPHEMRTPLNGILGCGEILAMDASTMPPNEVSEMGRMIFDSGKRLERLIENFLIYAQIELLRADPQKVSALRKNQASFAGKLVEQRARGQAEQANRGTDLVLEVQDVAISISDDYLGKIVDELVQNALKFSAPGSPVKVELVETAENILLRITDKGRGFAQEHIVKIGAYMQFDRKMQEQQGQGLGLVIAQRLAELHGGTLKIQSQQEKGTLVEVRLSKATAAK